MKRMNQCSLLLGTVLLSAGMGGSCLPSRAQQIIPPPNGNRNNYVYTNVPFNGYWAPGTGFVMPWAMPFGGYYNAPNGYMGVYPGFPGNYYQGFGYPGQRGNYQRGRGFGQGPQGLEAYWAGIMNLLNRLPQQGPLFMDPRGSNEALLLRRDDVRHELMLSGDQQNQLNQLILNARQDTANQIRQLFVQSFQENRQNLRDMTPEERQAFFSQQRQEVQTRIGQITTQQDQKLEAVLNDRQKARLHQLDLQWRTPMALVDDQLAAQLNLTPEQKNAIQKITNDFVQLVNQTRLSLFQPQTVAQANEGGLNGNVEPGPQGPPPRLDPSQFQMVLAELPQRAQQAEEKLYKARIKYGEKAAAVLTPEQKQKWQSLVGRPFYFNPNTLDDVALAQQQP